MLLYRQSKMLTPESVVANKKTTVLLHMKFALRNSQQLSKFKLELTVSSFPVPTPIVLTVRPKPL
jgi:hypothetical protein